MTINLPALRFGATYTSLNKQPVVDLGTGERLAELGLVRESTIATDCGREGLLDRAFETLQRIPVRQRIEMSVKAAHIFEHDSLDCGGFPQTPADYIDLLARTSGLSHTLAKANAGRISAALQNTEKIMDGLSRGLPLDIFDTYVGEQGGSTVRITPRIKALGACMPNNSPGVHVIWIISLAFGIPVLLRPGSSEPFTPYRLIQAFIKAGFPLEVFGFYPCDHAAADRIPLLTQGAIVFGSDATVQKWATNPLVQVHGAGYSKLFIGEDIFGGWGWTTMIPELAKNVGTNSGRSCFTVSRIVVPRLGIEGYARKMAGGLADELSKLRPGSLNDPSVMLSAMAMPNQAKLINEQIDRELAKGGATDMSALHQPNGRLVTYEGRTYLLPTVIFCESADHPLAKQEFLFPYVAVVEASNDEAFRQMGPTLSLAVYTKDEALIRRALRSSARLVSINETTSMLDRTQPHEENLFDLLWKRESFVQYSFSEGTRQA